MDVIQLPKVTLNELTHGIRDSGRAGQIDVWAYSR